MRPRSSLTAPSWLSALSARPITSRREPAMAASNSCVSRGGSEQYVRPGRVAALELRVAQRLQIVRRQASEELGPERPQLANRNRTRLLAGARPLPPYLRERQRGRQLGRIIGSCHGISTDSSRRTLLLV